MPQMAPLSWLTLFFYFILMFLIFNIKNYFLINYSPKSFLTQKFYPKFNWKW